MMVFNPVFKSRENFFILNLSVGLFFYLFLMSRIKKKEIKKVSALKRNAVGKLYTNRIPAMAGAPNPTTV